MKYSQERVREAVLRLGMCARRECETCEHKDRPLDELPSTECKKRTNQNINILADVSMGNAKINNIKLKRIPKQDTLCWECGKNGGKCSWSKDFTPVENWRAIPTQIQAKGHAGGRNHVDSFRVLECPEYEPYKRLKF